MSMMQSIKRFSWLVLLAFGLQGAWGYSLMLPVGFGPDAWQTPAIGYNPDGYLTGGSGLNTGPANLGEEYRRTTPVLYYAYDANFLGFFGSNGVAAVDSAFGILNSLTNVDNYSKSLTEFPEYSQQYNYAAQAAGLLDLKSITLNSLVLQLGLEDPQRYVWTLYDAYLPGGGKCPLDEEFEVVQRNYDDYDFGTGSSFYSSYINGTLFTYYIFEWPGCKTPAGVPYNFVTENYPVDPFAQLDSAVASDDGLDLGGFYTGLTRDDVACLRYLLTTNNINWESAAAGSMQLTTATNSANPQLFPVATGTSGVPLNGVYYGTADLGGLISASHTNNAAALELLYPGVMATTVSSYFGYIYVTNVTSYYTNYNGSPGGSPPVLVYATNITSAPAEFYVNTFANVITNHFRSNTVATLLTTTVGPLNGAPLGSPFVTNNTIKTVILTNVPSGDYYILPANTPCGVSLDILYTYWTNVVATTNVLVGPGTNVLVAPATNGINTNGYSYTQSMVTYLTNYVFVTDPVTCTETAGSTGLHEGIENIKFVKTSYDSLVGQFFQPITNNYTMTYVTNSQSYVQNFQRVVTAPDVLMTAADISGALPNFNAFEENTPNFNTANALPGEAGPGTIDPPTKFTYNSAVPIYLNFGLLSTNSYLGELTQSAMLAWGTFDGSTNPPVVYPSGSSIQNLQSQILLQIQPPPPALPDGTNNVAYPATIFATSGGGAFSPPFTWTVPGGGLPQGLSIASNPDNTATLSGTPARNIPGTFDFTLQLNDSLTPPRTVQWNYSITIH